MHNYKFKFTNLSFKNRYSNFQTLIMRVYIHKLSVLFKPFQIHTPRFKSLNLTNQNVKEG